MGNSELWSEVSRLRRDLNNLKHELTQLRNVLRDCKIIDTREVDYNYYDGVSSKSVNVFSHEIRLKEINASQSPSV